ncbi:hypothetical protein EXE40_11805 [Halorubrum sp. GN11GM_10-3_MGM]|nr:hypothetical protein EXE40_11805 [Halorubrum sp. GN11GM_10-3_MGM]
MGWTTLLAVGLFVFAWLTAAYQSKRDDWDTTRTIGMFVFLAGATCGVFLDDLLSSKSLLFRWIEPISAVVMVVGLFVAWIWKPEEDSP